MKRSKLKLTKRLRIPKNDQEEYLKECGFEIIAGVDEVGRGAWAGPLVAAAVILDRKLYGLRDSKLLTGKEREKLNLKIRRKCRVGIGEASNSEIDLLKMTKATQLAFRRALENLGCKIDFVLVDAFKIESPIPCRALKKGDMTCSSISAASIVAKVYRDKLMIKLDRKVKGYYFLLHKGYGTKLHQSCLKKIGPSSTHRKSFRPIKKFL
jgi:ribonuclease HII